MPILKLAPVESTNVFFLTYYDDYPATSNFNGTANISGRVVNFQFKRTALVKAFSTAVCLLNWLLAGTMLFITIVTFRGNKQLPEVLILLPVIVMLIVPTLRALLVNSPTFGELYNCWSIKHSDFHAVGILLGATSAFLHTWCYWLWQF